MPYQSRLEPLCQDIAKWKQEGACVVLLTGGEARGRRLQTALGRAACARLLLRHAGRQPHRARGAAAAGILYQGVCEPARGAVRHQRFRYLRHRLPARPQEADRGERIASFTDLKAGDYVVHDLHGVGLFKGVVQLENDGARRDYLLIQYAGNDKLYVPADQFDRVTKFIGSETPPPSSTAWAARNGNGRRARSSPASKSWPSTWPSSTPGAPRRRATPSATNTPGSGSLRTCSPTS